MSPQEQNSATTSTCVLWSMKDHPQSSEEEFASSKDCGLVSTSSVSVSSTEEEHGNEYENEVPGLTSSVTSSYVRGNSVLSSSFTEVHDKTFDGTENATRTKNSGRQERNHRITQFLICFLGINVCYLAYGLVQERLSLIMKSGGKERPPITTFILLSQSITNALAAFCCVKIKKQWSSRPGEAGSLGHREKRQERKSAWKLPLNHRLLMLTSLSYATAMTFSNESLRYVSYPTATLGKSCKLIPIMIAGVLVERKNYSAQEWLGALSITMGIAWFNLSRMAGKSGGEDSGFGLLLLLLSLMMDGALGWCQGHLKKNKNRESDQEMQQSYREPSPVETMGFNNLYAILFFGPYSIYTGQLYHGLDLLRGTSSLSSTAPEGIIQMVLLLNLTAAAGQFFIFYTIQTFNPVMCTTITTTRKFFTILLSIQRFGHVFSVGQWLSVLLVFGGLYIQIVCKIALGSSREGKGSSGTVGDEDSGLEKKQQ